MSKKTYAMAIRDTLSSEMERDSRVFVMGEDVEVLGGIFGCTRGLADKFGVDRCFNTPISEQEMIGAGLGAACTGMRPVVELMYMDFTFVCMDQILNQVAKTRYIFPYFVLSIPYLAYAAGKLIFLEKRKNNGDSSI